MHREGFQFYKPCKVLQPYIRYYWAFRSHRPMSVLTVPVGCPQIIFHKRTPLYIPELDVEQARLTVSGQVDFPARLCTDGDTEMIVVDGRILAPARFAALQLGGSGVRPRKSKSARIGGANFRLQRRCALCRSHRTLVIVAACSNDLPGRSIR